MAEAVEEARAEGFVEVAAAVGAAEAVLLVNSGWSRAAALWLEMLQHARHWCTELLGLCSSTPLQTEKRNKSN